MPDLADRAQTEAELLEKQVQERAPMKIANRLSAFICEICGDPIPEQRRKAVPGCTLCIDCQSEREAHQ